MLQVQRHCGCEAAEVPHGGGQGLPCLVVGGGQRSQATVGVANSSPAGLRLRTPQQGARDGQHDFAGGRHQPRKAADRRARKKLDTSSSSSSFHACGTPGCEVCRPRPRAVRKRCRTVSRTERTDGSSCRLGVVCRPKYRNPKPGSGKGKEQGVLRVCGIAPGKNRASQRPVATVSKWPRRPVRGAPGSPRKPAAALSGADGRKRSMVREQWAAATMQANRRAEGGVIMTT